MSRIWNGIARAGGSRYNASMTVDSDSSSILPGFACRGCGACCRIPDGIVRVSPEEIARIAVSLGCTDDEFIDRWTDLSPDRRGLVLKSAPDGACIFLTPGNRCRIHPVKPGKCRTFPLAWRNPDSAAVCPVLRDGI